MMQGYRNTWQRLLDGEYGRSVRPTSSTEAAHFYWCTDIKTPEIAAAFPEYDIGRAFIENTFCVVCEEQISVGSRNEAEKRVKELGETDRPQGRYSSRKLMCKACCAKDIEASNAGPRAEMQAREKRSKELRFMPYAEYLRTPEWQEKRQSALKRAGFRCQTCSAGGQLHVHHRTYINRGNERSSDLIVLCADCHSLFHANGKLAENGRAARGEAA